MNDKEYKKGFPTDPLLPSYNQGEGAIVSDVSGASNIRRSINRSVDKDIGFTL